ncbi:uncharacterized protein ACA1_222790 [Acanthamoeba castellanii str. Neff]|uniref:Uncharacterized protein n=1 Tax=Acanthamoeba castellanii (strain ATCC 30010 / Neff) TaxID=1257118 RepID=L8GTT1_ACACF|nr:uncharacterized protein ACA1_222790 [Acanthamoeba castellanii str. Neff]ELR16013.1 hypothetical protein ACA1_222790 [Acanthamoeba castellanii str. Neff]
MESVKIFSAAQHVPELRGSAFDEIAPHDEQFMKLKQQFLEVDIRDRELETILDYLNSKEDEITALKNILIETDEAAYKKTTGRLTLAIFCAREELTYAYEMERCQKLRRETKELALQAAQSCKRYVEAKQELTALQSAMAPEEAEELQRHTWYDQASQLIVGLSGASVESQGEDELVISVVPRTVEGLETERKYRLTVRFNPREDMALESLALSPADVPVEDLLFVSPTVASIHYVVIELQNRLHGHLRLQVELAKLSQRFGIAVVGDREIAVTFSTGSTCHLRIGGDYPRPYASIHITHIEGHLPASLAARLQDEKNRRVQGVPLKKLLKTVERQLQAET